MKLWPVVKAPQTGFAFQWPGARGCESLHVLNACPLWLAVLADDGSIIDILAPWVRAELWLEGIRYAYVTLADAGLGTIPPPNAVTANGVWAGGTNARLDTRHFPLAGVNGLSAQGFAAITPGTAFPPTKGIYVGGAGNATITAANGTVATFTGLLPGVEYPLSATLVATGATAADMVALY